MPPAACGRRCAVVGSPIAHSLSPTLHRAAYRHLGLHWSYQAVELTGPLLGPFVDGLDESWRGLSVTMPLKEEAARLATHPSDLVVATGAANTLVLEGNRRDAYNTDVAGLRACLRAAGVAQISHATVLGSGSTAVSAVAALAAFTSRVDVVARSPERARRALDLAATLDLRGGVTAWDSAGPALRAPLVVSTTPAGATDSLVPLVPPTPALLVDVVYDPWPTALAGAWARAGGTVRSGLDLLVNQAAEQVRLMTGRDVPVAVLRSALSAP
jgi:shikimate dehydrogenase